MMKKYDQCFKKVEKRQTRVRRQVKHLIFVQAPSVSLRGPGQIYIRGPKGRVYGWMDGIGWDGMDGWDGISKVSVKILYTL